MKESQDQEQDYNIHIHMEIDGLEGPYDFIDMEEEEII